MFPNPTIPNASNPGDYAQITYNHLGDASQVRRRNGQTLVMGYDSIGQLKSLAIPGLGTRTYLYDVGGRVTQTSLGVTLAYSYDALGRLTEKTHNGQLPVSYRYDYAGRMDRLTGTRPR